jgi:arylsulfatase A
MKITPHLIVAALLSVRGIGTVTAAETPIQKPNIVFILADDLGIGSLSCYGADHFKTPNIDKLAANGIRFEHCYSAPLCGPARCLVMTGRYAFRTGMTQNYTGSLVKPENEIMMPKVLKQAGYITAQVGKWNQLPLQPSDWGFDEYLRFAGSGKYWNTQPQAKTYTLNGKEVPLKDGEYLPDRMEAFAEDFINRHKDQPFYLYYPMSHVHAQILPTPDSAPSSKRNREQLYVDNVAYMDKLVGKLMAYLDRLNLREKTLVIFTSDNGTTKVEAPYCTIHGKPLSGWKATMLEGGSLVPMIANWPGTTPAGQVSESLIAFVDFFPTFGELTGAPMPKGVTIDGTPFTGILRGETTNSLRDWIYVQLDRRWFDRELNWKLNEQGSLFDMRGAPFTEPLVSSTTQDTEAAAARQRLQTVLDKLNPAAGKVDPGKPGNPEKRKLRKMQKRALQDSENANAVDQ